MHHTIARSNRASLQSSIPLPSTTVPLLHHQQQQQQQQQILYGPIVNPMVTLQPCGTGLHPPCIYPSAHRNAGLSASTLQMPGKNNRWQSKNKLSRCQQQYCQQQQPLSYNPKPLILYDHQASNNLPPTTTSFLVASSTFTHGPFPGEHYNNSGITLVPQPYFKPPDVQTFCLLQDQRQNPQQTTAGSYYNVSTANTCTLQTANSSGFQHSSLGPYTAVTTFTSNPIAGPLQTQIQSSRVFPNTPISVVFGGSRRENPPTPSSTFDIVSPFKSGKTRSISNPSDSQAFPIDPPTPSSAFDLSPFKPAKTRSISNLNDSQTFPIDRSENPNDDWPQMIAANSGNLFKPQYDEKQFENVENPMEKAASSVQEAQEERYSDESSTSFDFTIEAEKMVSALCNTTSSNDLEETRKANTTLPYSGTGDNVPKKSSWFDFCTDYESRKSVGVQTEGPADKSQYPELIRNTAYWGCTEAEIILNTASPQTDSRCGWLTSLSSATKTAITKSSTCFPVFAGDHIFANDLINALLRVSNGWLILDHYLNKQHYPSLDEKLNDELIRCFQTWQETTYEVLRQIVQTFLKLEENSKASSDSEHRTEDFVGSFPGDVSLYTNYDLFDPPDSLRRRETCEPGNPRQATVFRSPRRLRKLAQQQRQRACQKESKLRSKWTITENLTASIDSTKSVPDVSIGHADAGVHTSSRFRVSSSTNGKTESSRQSLNAEFFRLRNKVMESNYEATIRPQRWSLKDRKEYYTDGKFRNLESGGANFGDQISDGIYDNPYRKCTPKMNVEERTFGNPLTSGIDPVYSTPNVNVTGVESTYNVCNPYTINDCGSKSFKMEQQYENESVNADPVYIGKSLTDQLELAAVPRNKMTLLSQIEPITSEKKSEEMTANLSAWFANIRNSASGNHRVPGVLNAGEIRSQMDVSGISRSSSHREVSRSTIGLPCTQLNIDVNCQLQAFQNMQSIQSAPWNAYNLVNQVPEEYDSSEDVRVYMKPGSYNVPKKRHQRKTNRRLDSMSRSIVASSHQGLNSNREKDSNSIPSSSTPAARTATSSFRVGRSGSNVIKVPFPATPTVPPPMFGLENSPGILKRTESTLVQNGRQDVTWKAACASAEILLEALNVKETLDGREEKEDDLKSSGEKEDNETEKKGDEIVTKQEESQEDRSEVLKSGNGDCDGASSYEASEDDSGSTCKLSRSGSLEISEPQENKQSHSKTNVKTDSWLIRTLNNASIVNQTRNKDNTDIESSESSNSSVVNNEELVPVASSTTVNTATMIALTTTVESLVDDQVNFSQQHLPDTSLKKDRPSMKDTDGLVGKATYSETVRRCTASSALHSSKKECCKKNKSNTTNMSASCSIVATISERKCQRKNLERSYHLLHRSRKTFGRKTRSSEFNEDVEESLCSKSRLLRNIDKTKGISSVVSTAKLSSTVKPHGKKKDVNSGGFLENRYGGKSGDRGWSVWYSSRRRQGLSPLALSKLETIYQTIWQMDEAKIFKCPPSGDNNSSSMETIENYCKTIKNPMFLETIDYKLKNRVYHKVEHAFKDFRRIVYNSKLYHKSDNDRMKKIETLSKRLDELFEEHFASWDFGNISGSTREDSPSSRRLKSVGQKPVARRFAKKSPTSSVVAETPLLQ